METVLRRVVEFGRCWPLCPYLSHLARPGWLWCSHVGGQVVVCRVDEKWVAPIPDECPLPVVVREVGR